MAKIVHRQVAAITDANGGREKDDPDLAIPGQLFRPGRRIVKNITRYDLIKYNSYEDRKQKDDNEFRDLPDKSHRQQSYICK